MRIWMAIQSIKGWWISSGDTSRRSGLVRGAKGGGIQSSKSSCKLSGMQERIDAGWDTAMCCVLRLLR